jgi:DNA-binding transcriptional regulator YiaG
MKPAEFKSTRQALGLSQDALATILQMGGDGARTVRRWEMGERAVPGAVVVLLRLFVLRPSLMAIASRIERGPKSAAPSDAQP